MNSPWPLDAVRVGQTGDLPFGSDDRTILLWAEREGRILVTEDKRTMPDHLAAHLAAGHHVPGILIVRGGITITTLIEVLVQVAHASDEYEWRDRIEFIP